MLSLLQLMRLYMLPDRDEQASQASPLGERTLAILEKVLGPDHPSIAGQLEVVATTYEKRGRDAEAEVLRKRVIATGLQSVEFVQLSLGRGGRQLDTVANRSANARDKAVRNPCSMVSPSTKSRLTPRHFRAAFLDCHGGSSAYDGRRPS